MRTTWKSGFTLVELIVVVAILLVLAGLLTPVIQIASRAAQRTNTMALLGKVDAGLRRFKQDVGVYPFQAHDTLTSEYSDITNRLAFHLVRPMSPTDHADLRADLSEARAAYDSGVHRFTKTSAIVVSNSHGDGANRSPIAQVMNRMGRERAALMIQAGYSLVPGVAAQAGVPLLASGGQSRGWGGGYLDGEIPARNIKGDAIVDSYGNSLLYVCPVICGMKDAWVAPNILDGNSRVKLLRADHIGFQAEGRTAVTTLDTDLRTTAAAEYAFEFEVWSLGSDRKADPIRSARANADNLSAGPYEKALVR